MNGIVIFAVAVAASWLLTPLAGRLAIKVRLVDHPDRHRKLHVAATPLGGGIAILFSFVVAAVLLLWADASVREEFLAAPIGLAGLLAAAVLLALVGLLDDRFELRGRQKLAAQLLAVGVVISTGLCIERVHILNWDIELGILAVPFTMFWLLGAINAFNLIDGVDGLAGSVAFIFSVAFALMAHLTQHSTEALLCWALAGSVAGFLWYNLPPARIFLGDAGSMLIGLLLGALAIRSSLKGPATIALAAPTAIWAVPAFDVAMAILRRKLTGQSIYAADRSHLHHCLVRRGFGDTKTIVCIGVLCALTAAGALLGTYQHNEWLAVGSVFLVLCTLVMTRVFGHTECKMLMMRLKSFVASLYSLTMPPAETSREERTTVNDDPAWDELWRRLTDFGRDSGLQAVAINVNAPATGREYHASWERQNGIDRQTQWQAEIPIFSGAARVGRLRLRGVRNGYTCREIADLIAGVHPLEVELAGLIANIATERRLEVGGGTLPSAPPAARQLVRPVVKS